MTKWGIRIVKRNLPGLGFCEDGTAGIPSASTKSPKLYRPVIRSKCGFSMAKVPMLDCLMSKSLEMRFILGRQYPISVTPLSLEFPCKSISSPLLKVALVFSIIPWYLLKAWMAVKCCWAPMVISRLGSNFGLKPMERKGHATIFKTCN